MKTLGVAWLIAVATTVCVGQELDFQAAERQIVRLPPTAFPMLPAAIIRELQRRGCTIPQPHEVFSKTPTTDWFSKKPINVVSGHFAKPGQVDWAVLCSVNGTSSILVFWNGSPTKPADIARSEDKNYLQGLGGDKIGFCRGINPVGKDYIAEHYQAYGGPQPPPMDHQGIDDVFLWKASAVQYFFDGKWLKLTGSD